MAETSGRTCGLAGRRGAVLAVIVAAAAAAIALYTLGPQVPPGMPTPAAAAPRLAAPLPGSSSPAASVTPAATDERRQIFQDWEVVCAPREGTERCAFMQQQASTQSGQRVLAIELVPSDAGAEGMLVLPFGLDLASGIRLQIDAEAPRAALPFRTCIAAGCLVPVAFDQAAIAALRIGSMLKVQAATADSGGNATFQISLKGFGEARDGAAAMLR